MASTEKAVKYMEGVAADSSHGYDQTHRWGPDYDCSSLTIQAFKEAGFGVGDATYTGNMRRVFTREGFVVLPPSVAKQRGDILLNDVNHVAVYTGAGQLVQASINERGGITGGKSGDQTGREIAIAAYYDYPWNCVLRYTDAESAPTPAYRTGTKYAVCTVTSGWLVPVFGAHGDADDDGAAGIFGQAVSAIAVDGSEYRVHVRGGGWLEPVSKYDPDDWEYGMAGLGGSAAIDGVAIKDKTYRVHLLGGGWLDWVSKYDPSDWEYGMAGIQGKAIDALQVK
jgi:hypothetical protein